MVPPRLEGCPASAGGSGQGDPEAGVGVGEYRLPARRPHPRGSAAMPSRGPGPGRQRGWQPPPRGASARAHPPANPGQVAGRDPAARRRERPHPGALDQNWPWRHQLGRPLHQPPPCAVLTLSASARHHLDPGATNRRNARPADLPRPDIRLAAVSPSVLRHGVEHRTPPTARRTGRAERWSAICVPGHCEDTLAT